MYTYKYAATLKNLKKTTLLGVNELLMFSSCIFILSDYDAIIQ